MDLHCTWSLSKRVSSIRWTALTCYGHGDKHAHSHYLVPATSKHDNVSELEALPRLNLQGLLTLSLTAPHHTSWHVTAHLTAPHSTSQHLRHLRHTSPTNMQNANSQANTCQTPLSATNAYRPRSEPHAQLARHPTRMQHLQVVLVHPIEYFDECLMQ